MARERIEVDDSCDRMLDPVAGTSHTNNRQELQIFLEQVEPKWINESYPELEKISKLVQKIGMM